MTLLARIAERFYASLPPRQTFLEAYVAELARMYGARIHVTTSAMGDPRIVVETGAYPRLITLKRAALDRAPTIALDLVSEGVRQALGE